MKPKLNILFSCVGTKTAPSELRYDDVLHTKDWLQRTQKSPNRVKAIDLYSGPGWKQVLRIKEKLEKKYDATLWVFSAGYGFLREDDLVVGYNATFSASATEDRVRPTNQYRWLNGVNQRELPEGTVLVLPKSYERPFAILDKVDRHILIQGTAEDRSDMGCSMIRCSTTLMEKILDNQIEEDWDLEPSGWACLRGYEV